MRVGGREVVERLSSVVGAQLRRDYADTIDYSLILHKHKVYDKFEIGAITHI